MHVAFIPLRIIWLSSRALCIALSLGALASAGPSDSSPESPLEAIGVIPESQPLVNSLTKILHEVEKELVNYNDAVQVAIDQIGTGGGLFLPLTGGTLTGNLVAQATVTGRIFNINDSNDALRSRIFGATDGNTYLDLENSGAFPAASLFFRRSSDFVSMLEVTPEQITSNVNIALNSGSPPQANDAVRKDYVDTQAKWQGRSSFVSTAAPTTEGVDGDIWFQI